MLVTDFHFKNFMYLLVNAAFQLVGVGRFQPFRERERRALMNSVDYIEAAMPEALILSAVEKSIINPPRRRRRI